MSTTTPNLGLYKKDSATDGSDTFNIKQMLNDNWDKVDAAVKGLSDGAAADTKNLSDHAKDYTLQIPYGGATTGTANTYAITTPTITALSVGMAVAVKINEDSSGAATLNWCSLGAKSIKNPDGSIPNLKAGGIYTLRYDGTNFVLQGGDVGTLDPETITTYTTGSFSKAVRKGQLSVLNLTGVSVSVINKNGNFANSVDGWNSDATSTLTVANNILSVVGNGAFDSVWIRNDKPLSIPIGKKVFARIWARVTNSDCQYLKFESGVNSVIINNPVQNQWYPLYNVFSDTVVMDYMYLRAHYADSAASNGKTMEVKEEMVIDMGADTSNPLYNKTSSEMNVMFPNWLKQGVVSTDCGRYKSISMNKLKLAIGSVTANGVTVSIDSDGYITMNGTASSNTDFRIVNSLAGGDYTVTAQPLQKYGCIVPNVLHRVTILDKTGTHTGSDSRLYGRSAANPLSTIFDVPIDNPIAFTPTNECLSIGIYITSGTVFSDFKFRPMIEIGVTASTVYIPYANTTAYTPPLPTPWDSFNVLTGNMTQGGSDKVVLDGSLAWTFQLDGSGFKRVGYAGNIAGVNYTEQVLKYNGIFLTPSAGLASADNSALFNGGLYLTLADSDTGWTDSYTPSVNEIKAYFYGWKMCNSDGSIWDVTSTKYWKKITDGTGITITLPTASYTGYTPYSYNYQLATPIISYHPASSLVGGPNYTVSGEPYIHGENVYDSGVSLNGKVAKSMEWVTKFDSNGVFTPMDMSKIHLASDGKSFTVDGAVDEDFYEYGAYPIDGDSTNGQITATAETTLAGSVNANTDAISQLSQDNNNIHTQVDVLFTSVDNGKSDVYSAIVGKGVTPASKDFADLTAGINSIPKGQGVAVENQVLKDVTFSNQDGVLRIGTMPNNGPVAAETVNLTTEGAEYTIAAGYHSGLRKIKAVISGLIASVIKAGSTVGGIVGNFTADATATASQMLSGAIAYVNGNKVTGTMPNNGSQSATLDTTTTSKTIPSGYTSGGTVNIVTQEKSVTPSATTQEVTSDAGKVLSKVTVAGAVIAEAFSVGETKVVDIQVSVAAVSATSVTKLGAGIQIKASPGTIRLKYSLSGNTVNTTYAVVYKNGSQVGTVRTVTNDTWIDYTEDFSYNYGDTFEIRAWSTVQGYEIYLRNFALYATSIPVYYQTV